MSAGVTTVVVAVGERAYDVVVGPGAAGELAPSLASLLPGARRAALVTDENVAAQPWFAAIDAGLPTTVHEVPAGERAKTLRTVESLCRAFATHGLTRADVVVAVGGGVVTDVAGFAAATYHRGTAYLNVPTTLLCQVDAGIGGKTGVDLPEGKNLVGAFWQPARVLCDTAVLSTLPGREWSCGHGEIAKYAFVDGRVEAWLADAPVEAQVARCAEVKARIVAEDEREGGRRALLNYGHTLAHALEAASLAAGGDLRHGEAVAVGLVYAALLARRLGRIGEDRVALHRAVVARFELSAELPDTLGGAGAGELMAYMARDKKASGDGGFTFVLDGPAGLEVVRGVDAGTVRAALEELGCT